MNLWCGGDDVYLTYELAAAAFRGDVDKVGPLGERARHSNHEPGELHFLDRHGVRGGALELDAVVTGLLFGVEIRPTDGDLAARRRFRQDLTEGHLGGRSRTEGQDDEGGSDDGLHDQIPFRMSRTVNRFTPLACHAVLNS